MDIKKQLAAVAAKLNIPKVKGKEITFAEWLPRATCGKSQQEVLNLLDLYQAKRDMERSLGKTLVELKKNKKVQKPEHLIVKSYGFMEIVDASITPCGVKEFDNQYKDFLIGYSDPTKPPPKWFTKVFPTIIAEAKIFNSRAHVYAYLRDMLKKGIARERIRRFMREFYIGRDEFKKKMEQLKERFCVRDGAGIRGLLVKPAATHRVPRFTAVKGEGKYARIVRY